MLRPIQSPAVSPSAVLPQARAKQEKEAESTQVVTRRKRKAPAAKSSFQPLFANNPSMRNILQKKTDTVSISQSGKLTQLLQQLAERKEAVQEQRKMLVENTLARGDEMEDIEEPLKGFEEQLATLDEQVADAIARQTQLEAEGRQPKKEEDAQPPTSENADDDAAGKIFHLSGLSARMSISQAAMDAGDKVQTAARVATAQLKNDDLQLETRLYRRMAAEGLAGLTRGEIDGKPCASEIRAIQAGRRAYAKEMRQIERETTQKIVQLEQAGGKALSEVREALRPEEETQEDEKPRKTEEPIAE